MIHRFQKLAICLRLNNGHYRWGIRLIFFMLIVLSVFSIIFPYQKQQDVRYCFIDNVSQQPNSNAPHRLEDLLQAEYKPPLSRSIFFHETSCHRSPHESSAVSLFRSLNSAAYPAYNLVQLNARQACAIESAALHNPSLSIFVLFASPTYRDNTTHQPIIDAILSYPNVYLRNINLWTYASSTPIYDWLKDGQLFNSHYVLSHISDFLRFLTLYRWGGIYLDMDIIMLRSVEKIPPNFSGAESNTHIAAGVMNLAHDGFGHEIAEKCLRDFQLHFDGNDWGNNGPGVITRVAQSICGTKDITLMMNRKRCMGFNVFKREAFYAIPWKQWDHFFEPAQLEQTMKRTNQSIVVHVWNKHSKQRQFKVGTNAAYGKLAEQHCPKVYASAGEYF